MAQFDHLLRNAAPVYWSDLWACWILTRYDDIVDPNDRKFDSQWQCVGGRSELHFQFAMSIR